MSNRKATFAKRQRESDLKDHAKAKDARRAERQSQPKTSKGPEIAWDQQVYATDSGPEGENSASLVPTDDTSADVTPAPAPPAATGANNPQNPNSPNHAANAAPPAASPTSPTSPTSPKPE